jgi:hypothetical protein
MTNTPHSEATESVVLNIKGVRRRLSPETYRQSTVSITLPNNTPVLELGDYLTRMHPGKYRETLAICNSQYRANLL